MQGGRRMVPNVSGPYPGFPPSSSQPLVADNFPMDPPSMPRDPEMLKNIDLLSSFVVKNGPEFEQLARTKQIGDPKFGFLFGGEPDTDAAIGQRYYEWKKQALKASLQSQSGSGLHSERPSAEDAEKLTSDAPPSPVGSDMDMEDDFSAPAPALEKKVASRIVQPVDTKAFPVIEDTRRRTGFDRSCMEDISPSRKSVSPSQQPLARSRDRVSDQDRKPSSVANGHHGEGTPRSSRWAPPEPSFILEAPESNETSSLQKPEKSETAEKLEAVTPPTADDLDPPENKRRSDGRRIQDPKNAIRDSSVLEPGGPTVDEFGRLVRRATSDSDGDDTRHGKKRRRSPSRSQSRSRSPGEHLRRHHSRSRSPPRRRRRSRSHSHSSRRHRSYSPSPPPRDSRRGAESSWGSDRRFQERGARRGGQGERVGGSQPACFDFSRGRCFRGSSCRFLHADNNSNGASSEKNYTAHALMMQQPGFDGSLPPPPPLPPFMEHHHSSQLQASYPVPVPQSPAYSQISGHLHPAGFPQMGIQHPPIPLRPGSAWPTAHTVNQPIQGYGIPSSTSTPPQQTNLQPFSQQHPHVSASKEQYDPLMADSFEPEPPGAREVAPKPELGGPQDISMVIMERVSPGLPSRHHPVTSTTVSQGDSLVTETLSPTTLVPTGKQRSHSAIESLHAHPATVVSTHGSFPSHINNQVSSGLENVSPATDENQNWNSGPVTSEKESGPTGDTKDRDHNQLQSAKNDKEEHSRVGRDKEGRVKEGRGLTLVRAAVTEYVKDVLKPTWREGHMSKEAFKTIAKKAVDKVLGALQPHQIPKTPEKVDTYMTSSRPKILKLVQGYVDKYVKV
ncbi:unnamed protein product [Sphagnum jensenii]|uniref:C3H1-type domain-containing protein n=1 Tax=Sphagnum jensenii TaxID=128206 RepID=A0ABP1C416_9BRYO